MNRDGVGVYQSRTCSLGGTECCLTPSTLQLETQQSIKISRGNLGHVKILFQKLHSHITPLDGNKAGNSDVAGHKITTDMYLCCEGHASIEAVLSTSSWTTA